MNSMRGIVAVKVPTRGWSDSVDNPNGSYQRTRAARIRDPWFKDTLRHMGGIASYNRFCHLFINGLYWGTYDFTEQPTDSFARNYFGGEKEDFDIFDQGTLKAGTEKAFQLMQQVSSVETAGNYERITRLLNVPEFNRLHTASLFRRPSGLGIQQELVCGAQAFQPGREISVCPLGRGECAHGG